MNLDQKNVAYDLSLFEKKRKKNNVIKIPKNKFNKENRSKNTPITALFTVVSSIIIISVISIMIHGQIQLSELTSKLNAATKQLDESESIHTQLKAKAESKLSLRSVEDFALYNLGMRKTMTCQKEYINSEKSDKADVDQTKSNDNVLSLLKEIFTKLKS